MSEGITPGRGGGVIVPVVAGAGATVLPATGAKWAVPVAAAIFAVLVVWGVAYFVKNRNN